MSTEDGYRTFFVSFCTMLQKVTNDELLFVIHTISGKREIGWFANADSQFVFIRWPADKHRAGIRYENITDVVLVASSKAIGLTIAHANMEVPATPIHISPDFDWGNFDPIEADSDPGDLLL